MLVDGHRQPFEDPPGSRAGPGRGSEPRRGRRSRRRGLLVIGLVVLVAIPLLWGLWRYLQFDFAEVPGVDPPAEGQAANWLLVGIDSRQGLDEDEFLGSEETIPGARADTIMVIRVRPDSPTVDLMSIPRDLWVPVVGRGESGRINGAFNGGGGRERLVRTTEQALGINIHRYAEINFVGFQELVDALGGVPVWFAAPARDLSSGLDIVDAGCHVLNGSQALAFARSREFETLENGEWRLDPTADIGRTGRQRQFLSAVASSASERVGLGGLLSMNGVLSAAADNMVIAEGTGASDLVGLLRTFAAGGAQVNTHTLPIQDAVTSGGSQVLELRQAEAEAVLDLFRSPGEAPPAAEQLSGDLTVPEARVVTDADLSEDRRSEALAGVTEAECASAG